MSKQIGEFLIGTMTLNIFELLDWQTKRAEPIEEHQDFVWVYALETEAQAKKLSLELYPIFDPFLPLKIRT